MAQSNPAGLELVAPPVPDQDRVLTPDALSFVAALDRRFRDTRRALLAARA